MEWNRKDTYFIKLNDGSCITGTILEIYILGDSKMIEMEDKFNNKVGFREEEIYKYELLTKINNVNNTS